MQLKSTCLLIACLALAGSLPALAHQSRGGQATGQKAGQGTMRNDRLHTQDRLDTPDQDRDRDMDRDQDRDMDRDQIHDRTHDSNNQIYGYALMTPAERAQYRTEINKLNTLQERNQYRHQHMIQMQDRARERGVTLPGMNGTGGGSGKT